MKVNMHVVVAAMLLVLAIFLAYNAVQLNEISGAEKQQEMITSVLLAVTSGIGGIYLFIFKSSAELEKMRLEATLARLNTSLDNGQKLMGGMLASSTGKFLELEYGDDFRKRERRDKALLNLSAAVMKTTRAFRSLTAFNPADESTDSLVNALAQALASRETFLAAREELTVLHVIEKRHKETLREYALLLIGIIIDLRRDPTALRIDGTTKEYSEQMEKYRGDLDRLDDRIGRILEVFLAPKHREPITPMSIADVVEGAS